MTQSSPSFTLPPYLEPSRRSTPTDGFGAAWNPIPPQALSAHRLPWPPASMQQVMDSNQGIPCVLLQAAGYAPRYPLQNIHGGK